MNLPPRSRQIWLRLCRTSPPSLQQDPRTSRRNQGSLYFCHHCWPEIDRCLLRSFQGWEEEFPEEPQRFLPPYSPPLDLPEHDLHRQVFQFCLPVWGRDRKRTSLKSSHTDINRM